LSKFGLLQLDPLQSAEFALPTRRRLHKRCGFTAGCLHSDSIGKNHEAATHVFTVWFGRVAA